MMDESWRYRTRPSWCSGKSAEGQAEGDQEEAVGEQSLAGRSCVAGVAAVEEHLQGFRRC